MTSALLGFFNVKKIMNIQELKPGDVVAIGRYGCVVAGVVSSIAHNTASNNEILRFHTMNYTQPSWGTRDSDKVREKNMRQRTQDAIDSIQGKGTKKLYTDYIYGEYVGSRIMKMSIESLTGDNKQVAQALQKFKYK